MGRGKILVIDDLNVNVLYLTSILANEGYDVLSGNCAEKAINLIATYEFDLILLDIIMPGADGYEVCTLIRTSSLNTTTPVIFITSKNDEASILKGFKIGAQDYIIKPFIDSELVARVNTQVELKRSRAELKLLNNNLELTVKKQTHELKSAVARLSLSYKRLRRIQNELLSLEQAKENFLKIINHEIRTPLNGILGFQELIKRNCNDQDLMEYIEMMEESVKRLEKFSMDALLITQIRTRMYRPVFCKIDVHAQVENALDLYDSALRSGKIIVRKELQESCMYTDENLFQYTLKCLVENAVNRSPAGQDIRILGEQLPGGYYQIQITDKGEGFPAEILEKKYRLFANERFVDNLPGLRLYTVSLIMKFLQGRLHLTNCPGGGASVFIRIKSMMNSN